MTSVVFCPEIVELIERSNLEVFLSEDGRVLEIGADLSASTSGYARWMIQSDGSVVLSRVLERDARTQFAARFQSWEYAERWLAAELASSLRQGAQISISSFKQDADPRFELNETVIEAQRVVDLVVGGDVVARFLPTFAAYATHVLLEPVELIVRSFADPEGRPLYSTEPIVPPSQRN